MTRQAFAAMAAGGPVLLDGATGSNLRAAGMPVGVPPERWVLDHPTALLDLQRAYVDAGSRILMAPTFSANRPALDRFGLAGELGALNAALVGLTREAAGGRALVAGDLSTLGQPLEPLGPISYGEAYDVYREQMEALAEAGADLLAVETLMGIDEAAAALDAAGAVCGLPVLCSFSVEADGTVPFGGTALEALLTAQELGASAVGVNCSVGPDQLEAVVRHRQAQRGPAGDRRAGPGGLHHGPPGLCPPHGGPGPGGGVPAGGLLRLCAGLYPGAGGGPLKGSF